MTKEEAIKMGFKDLPHFTIQNIVIYDLGRNRQLSLGDANTPNEILFISELDAVNPKHVTDSVCLHNYDFEGVLSQDKVKSLISLIVGAKWKHIL